MQNQTTIQIDIIEGLKKILKESFPHCKESPHKETLVEINKIAHECLKKIERSTVNNPYPKGIGACRKELPTIG